MAIPQDNQENNPYFNAAFLGNAGSTIAGDTTTGASVGGPWGALAGAGVGLLGTGVQAYGATQQADQAQQQYAQAVKAYEDEKKRQAELDAQALQQQHFAQTIASGNYAHSAQDKVKNDYENYAHSLGM